MYSVGPYVGPVCCKAGGPALIIVLRDLIMRMIPERGFVELVGIFMGVAGHFQFTLHPMQVAQVLADENMSAAGIDSVASSEAHVRCCVSTATL